MILNYSCLTYNVNYSSNFSTKLRNPYQASIKTCNLCNLVHFKATELQHYTRFLYANPPYCTQIFYTRNICMKHTCKEIHQKIQADFLRPSVKFLCNLLTCVSS